MQIVGRYNIMTVMFLVLSNSFPGKRRLTRGPLFVAALRRYHRVVQVQVVHRHGDRSPITPLKDEEYWTSKLVSQPTLDKIAHDTHLVQDADGFQHTAGGRGPFGKLTELGLLQMVQVGNTLKDMFVKEQQCDKSEKGSLDDCSEEECLFTPGNPLCPSRLRIYSTAFPRAVQSVQGLLVGLFPDGVDESIPIDVRNTLQMIPDPQPRLSKEQEHLERMLAARPKVLQSDREMLPLALKATKALAPLLAKDAHAFAFGASETDDGKDDEEEEISSIEIEPLAWNQIAELTKCLSVHDRLPEELTAEDTEAIHRYVAQRWIRNLSHPRLVRLAMGKMVEKQLEIFTSSLDEDHDENKKCLTIWSAHDSTLIGLLCSYRLLQPAKWPEYASYLVIELIEATDEASDNKKEYLVRFSLNGEILKSAWDDDEEPLEMIPLSCLAERIRTAGVAEPVSSSY